MNLQELLDNSELDLNVDQVKAFFLGIFSAERPLPFSKAVSELLADTPDLEGEFIPELKRLWTELEKDTKKELGNLFSDKENVVSFLENAKEQLDYFLTGMSLSGTNADSCKNEELLEFIEVIEETIEDLDDYISENKPDTEEGEEIKEDLLANWEEFIASK